MTADAIVARAFADGRKDQATGTFGGSVTGLVVAGAAVSVQPGGQFEIPGIGYGAVNERRVVRSDGALSRLRGRAAHPPQLRLAQPAGGHRDPARLRAAAAAGHETAGKAAAGRARAAGRDGRRSSAAASRAPTRRSSTRPVVPLPRGRQDADRDRRRSHRHRVAAARRLHAHAADRRRRARQQLVCPGYVFPVAGGALYGHDFGNFRADTIFHQGSDLFAPEGSPLVAVQAGVLHNVGWNRLGGWRLWLEDVNGNWFYYAHLSAFAPIAVEGARVKRGRRRRLHGPHRRRRGRPVPPALRDPPGGPVVGPAL